jgi:diadenosine tetraphosphate (Ap4A) HIT family hydrolase
MWNGDNCAMCADSPLPRNEHGDLLVETASSYIRLSRNQTQAGYCVVIAKRHAPEMHHLTADERVGFWNDVSITGEAISTIFQPVKLAQLCMGFRMPHFHCHIYPQYETDDPFGLLNPQDGDVRLERAEWDNRVERIRAELEVLQRR